MKILKRLIRVILIFFVIVYVLPAALLQIPYFQKKISHKVASYLTDRLQTEVRVGQIEMGFFNKLVIKDIYLEDKSGEVLFQAKRVAAGFEFLPILRKKWRFDSIQLFTFQLNLSKETDDSPLNIQYIIDAFAKKDTIKTNPEIDLQIKKLSLLSGRFSFRVKDKAETPGVFNPKQLLLTDISSKIRINNFTNKELALQFNKLGFKEQSGLQLKNLTFDLVANNKMATINQLTVELDKSLLHLSDLSANYDLSPGNKKGEVPVTFQLQLKNSVIYPRELSAIIPALSHFDDKVSLEGDFSGTGNDLAIRNFYFRYYNQVMISANADLRNLFYPDKKLFYIKGSIPNSFFSPEGIERLVNNFSQQPVELPIQIKQMKEIRFEGDVNGSFDDLTAWGVLNTDVGVIRTNLTMGKDGVRFIKGQIASENLNMEKLLNNKDYGDMTFDIRLDAKQNPDKKFSGTIDATLAKFVYKGYTYSNLSLNGDFSPTSFDGRMSLNSPEVRIEGEGLWAFNGKNSKFDFSAKISDVQLDKLNLTSKYQHPVLSFELNADLTGDNPDDFAGTVSLKNLNFKTDKGSYFLDNLLIASSPSMQEKRLNLDSKVLSGELWGNFSFKTIIPALKQTFAGYLPTLIKPNPTYSDDENTEFSVNLAVEDMTNISKAFELPFVLRGPTNISGKYNAGKASLEFTTPHAQFGGSRIDSLRLSLNSSEDTARVDIKGISLQKKNAQLKFNIGIDAAGDKINTLLHWGNASSNYRGDLKLTTMFSQDENSPLRIETNIQPAELVFNDSVWTLYPASLVVDSSNVRIEHLQAFHKDQFLKIQGEISHNPEKELQIDLNRVDLDYIFQSLSIPALEFGGLATGFVTAQDLFRTRKLETRLDVTDFTFNSVNFGHLDLTGTWDDANQGVLMLGKIKKNDSTFVDVNGIIYPVKEELSINFDAENADARFLRKYMDKVVQDLSGNLSGHLRLFGDLNNPTIEGDVFAKNCRFGIGYLNTFYTFTDSIKCLPDTIKANNITLYDERGNKAIASGYVKHQLFQNFYFSANISYSNFMIFNATKTLNPMFYGTAFGNGTAQLYGTPDVINIDVSAQNIANTKMTLNFMEEADIVDYDFIRFVSVKNPVAAPEKSRNTVLNPAPSTSSEGPEIRFNLLLDVTPEATIDMIMDPISGDKISGYGKGNLQIQYGTKIPLKVLGNYVIEHGKYNFSLQQLFIRNFDIQDGSSVNFLGDPYSAQLNIKANYTVNANLEDLDPMLIENKKSARNIIPVSCILLLTGPLNRPAVAFDLDLPGATEELVRQVKGYIRTDDMMSRQIVYLLVLSRFYTPPENMRDNSTNANSNLSYLTSTLSTQISNLLGTLSDNFRVGTIFHQTNNGVQTGTEFDLLLSSQLLNNLLIVNGNFGYSDRSFYNTNQNKLPVVGDFDLEYKLTRSGDIRLKGFNHYNYRYFNSITPEMTQGIGILFRKDFNYWLEMFKKKRNQ